MADVCSCLMILTILFSCVNLSRPWQNLDDTRSCSYTFKVWHPDRHILQRINTMEFKLSNVSTNIEKEFLKIKHSALSELHICQNWTAGLERDIMNMRLDKLQEEMKTKDVKLTMLETKQSVRELSETLNGIKNELNTMRNHGLKKRMIGLENMDDRSPVNGGMSMDVLQDTVVDLKAEWVIVKRDIYDLQRELSRVSENHISDFNLTQVIQDRIRQLSHATVAVQKKLEHGETKYRILNSNFNRLKQIVSGKLELIDDIKSELSVIRNDMTNDFHYQGKEITTRGTYTRSFVPQRVMQQPNSKVHNYHNVIKDSVDVPTDCEDIRHQGIRTSGVYQIKPHGMPFFDGVYCEFANNKSYTVIHRRVDGNLDFDRRWVEYKYGFGNLYGEHWLGNEIVHILSNLQNYILRIDMWDWEGGKAYAEYSVFSIDTEQRKYALRVSGYSGNAGDSLSYHNGMKFSTEDNDNDVNIRNCATDNKSGWWFESCFLANLNGVYRKGWYTHDQSSSSDGIVWYTWKDSESYSLKKAEMKIYRA